MEPNKTNYNEVAKPEKPTNEPVKPVTKDVKIRKKSFGRRFADIFFAEDVYDVKDYIIKDVVIPTVRDGIVDTIIRGVEMIFYGQVRGGRRRDGSRTSGTYVSYNGYSSIDRRDVRAREPERSRAKDDYNYKCWTKDKAWEKYADLEAIFESYRQITISDVYDVMEMSGKGSVDNDYGWTTMESIRVKPAGDGWWYVNFPRPIQLD